jgi:fructose 1,6-bisphosphatase
MPCALPAVPTSVAPWWNYSAGIIVSCTAFGLRDDRMTLPVDVFDHPMWDQVRTRIADKAVEIRRQGFFGNAMQAFENIHCGVSSTY